MKKIIVFLTLCFFVSCSFEFAEYQPADLYEVTNQDSIISRKMMNDFDFWRQQEFVDWNLKNWYLKYDTLNIYEKNWLGYPYTWGYPYRWYYNIKIKK